MGAADHRGQLPELRRQHGSAAQSRTLSDAENARAQQALAQARLLVNPSAGILGVAMGKSSDHPGEGAVILYVDENTNAARRPLWKAYAPW